MQQHLLLEDHALKFEKVELRKYLEKNTVHYRLDPVGKRLDLLFHSILQQPFTRIDDFIDSIKDQLHKNEARQLFQTPLFVSVDLSDRYNNSVIPFHFKPLVRLRYRDAVDSQAYQDKLSNNFTGTSNRFNDMSYYNLKTDLELELQLNFRLADLLEKHDKISETIIEPDYHEENIFGELLVELEFSKRSTEEDDIIDNNIIDNNKEMWLAKVTFIDREIECFTKEFDTLEELIDYLHSQEDVVLDESLDKEINYTWNKFNIKSDASEKFLNYIQSAMYSDPSTIDYKGVSLEIFGKNLLKCVTGRVTVVHDNSICLSEQRSHENCLSLEVLVSEISEIKTIRGTSRQISYLIRSGDFIEEFSEEFSAKGYQVLFSRDSEDAFDIEFSPEVTAATYSEWWSIAELRGILKEFEGEVLTEIIGWEFLDRLFKQDGKLEVRPKYAQVKHTYAYQNSGFLGIYMSKYLQLDTESDDYHETLKARILPQIIPENLADIKLSDEVWYEFVEIFNKYLFELKERLKPVEWYERIEDIVIKVKFNYDYDKVFIVLSYEESARTIVPNEDGIDDDEYIGAEFDFSDYMVDGNFAFHSIYEFNHFIVSLKNKFDLFFMDIEFEIQIPSSHDLYKNMLRYFHWTHLLSEIIEVYLDEFLFDENEKNKLMEETRENCDSVLEEFRKHLNQADLIGPLDYNNMFEILKSQVIIFLETLDLIIDT
jgi:hypothetical protein